MCRKRCTDYPRETWEEGGGVSVLTIYLQNGRENKTKYGYAMVNACHLTLWAMLSCVSQNWSTKRCNESGSQINYV